MKIVKFILALLFGLMFIYAGLGKFFPQIVNVDISKLTPEQVKIFEAFGTLKWLMPLVGFIEILGGLLFIFPKTRALAAIMILPVMVGVLLHNFTFSAPKDLAIPIILLIINIWMIFDNWKKYQALVK